MAVSFQLSDAPQVVHGCSCGRTSVAATIVLSCCVSLLCPSIVCFSLGLSVCLPHSSTGLSVCLPVSQFVYPPGCLSVCLAVCLSLAPSFGVCGPAKNFLACAHERTRESTEEAFCNTNILVIFWERKLLAGMWDRCPRSRQQSLD